MTVDTYLYDTFIDAEQGVTARENAYFETLSGLSLLIALLIAFFCGGILAGLISCEFPDLNGVVSSVILVFSGFVILMGPLITRIWDRPATLDEAYSRAENLGNVLVFSFALGVISPFLILAGYFAAKLANRFRNTRNPATIGETEA